MFRKSTQLVIIAYFSFLCVNSAFASSPLDLNNNGIVDSEEEAVMVTVGASLPAGEYTFKNLIITSGVTLTLERNIDSVDPFKGVKINAENITIESGATISASAELAHGVNYGQGAPGDDFYYAGASYGGVGRGNSPTSTYGSATKPTDLGSDGYYRGGGAIWLAVSNTLTNNGQVLARGGQSASGGSIYVTAKNIAGSGLFNANGGNRFTFAYNKSPGGGGRIALYYETNIFEGIAEAKGGCGDGFCAGDGTVGYFDTLNNDFSTDATWHFLKGDGPFTLHKILITDGATVGGDEGAEISASELLVTQGSSLVFSMDQVLRIPKIDIDALSTVTFSGQESLTADTLMVSGSSTVTVLPESTLHLIIPAIHISSGSSISVYGKGYDHGMGPGAPVSEFAGASYGGVGYTNSTSTTYGSELEPTDFGSGGNGYKTRGGGAIRIESDSLTNDGLITAEGLNTSSGGSIYITTNTVSGSGEIRANGGGAYWSSRYFFMGGGGRVALYYQTSTFTGAINVLGGCASPNGSTRVCAGDGTVVNEQQVSGISNILFLPGIQASRLYKDGILGTEDQVWPPSVNFGEDLHDLAMTSEGFSENVIYTRDVIDSSLGVGSVYGGFLNFLEGLKTSELPMKEYTSFAYDWRYDVTDIIESGAPYEDELRSLVVEVQRLSENSYTKKVTIVAHSNGGLLAKALLIELENSGIKDKIDRVIFLGVPQLGTPKAIGTILHGYDQADELGGIVIDAHTAREVINNMPGAYGLLPSEKYFATATETLVTFEDSTSTASYRATYGNSINSFAEYKEFLLGTENGTNRTLEGLVSMPAKANSTLLQKSLDNHKNKLDDWVVPEGVEVIEIVGTGLPTMKGIEYRSIEEGEDCISISGAPSVCTPRQFLKPYAQLTKYGDETVVQSSADAYGGVKKSLYINLSELKKDFPKSAYKHYNLTEISQIQDLISKVMLATSTEGIQYASTSQSTFNDEYYIEIIDSPIRLLAEDTEGNQTGTKIIDGEQKIFEDIPGSLYFEFGDTKYLVLPRNTEHKTTLFGEEYGNYGLTIARLGSGDVQTIEHQLQNATVTPQMVATYTLKGEAYSSITSDMNGDGIAESEMTLEGEPILKEVTYRDLIEAIHDLELPRRHERMLLVLVAQAERLSKHYVDKHRKGYAEDAILHVVLKQVGIYKKMKLITKEQYRGLEEIIINLIKK